MPTTMHKPGCSAHAASIVPLPRTVDLEMSHILWMTRWKDAQQMQCLQRLRRLLSVPDNQRCHQQLERQVSKAKAAGLGKTRRAQMLSLPILNPGACHDNIVTATVLCA